MPLHTYEYLCYLKKYIIEVCSEITTSLTLIKTQTVKKLVENLAPKKYMSHQHISCVRLHAAPASPDLKQPMAFSASSQPAAANCRHRRRCMKSNTPNVMGEQVDCSKMATMCGRSRLRLKTSRLYIYLWL